MNKKAFISFFSFLILSLALYTFSIIKLHQPFDYGFILILSTSCLIYFWYFRNINNVAESTLDFKTALILIFYALIYIMSIYFIHILGSSVTLWLVQFLIPLALLKFFKQPIETVQFRWNYIFKDFKIVLLASGLLIPFFLFGVRDSKQILQLFATGKGLLYLPISILYMLIIVAFWEEFFFRAVVQNSLIKVTNNRNLSILLSSFLFGIYHLPMRYFNAKSPYYGNFLDSFSATINEQFVMGIFLGVIVYKSKNVWHGIWLHSILNGLSFAYQLSLMLKI